MKTLSIDIETYSDIPLQKTGVYRYCESPNFEILLFGYSIDSGPVQVVDLTCGGAYPQRGAGRTGGRFRHQVGPSMPPSSGYASPGISVIPPANILTRRAGIALWSGRPRWACRFLWKASVLFSVWRSRKLTEGKELIKYFCQPLSSHQGEWPAHQKPALPCAGQVGAVQTLQCP